MHIAYLCPACASKLPVIYVVVGQHCTHTSVPTKMCSWSKMKFYFAFIIINNILLLLTFLWKWVNLSASNILGNTNFHPFDMSICHHRHYRDNEGHLHIRMMFVVFELYTNTNKLNHFRISWDTNIFIYDMSCDGYYSMSELYYHYCCVVVYVWVVPIKSVSWHWIRILRIPHRTYRS